MWHAGLNFIGVEISRVYPYSARVLIVSGMTGYGTAGRSPNMSSVGR